MKMKLFGTMKQLSIVTMMVFMWLPTSVIAQENRYDINKDGKVNITDAMLVVDYVLKLSSVETDTIPYEEDNAPCKAVDLGLPSGTKWASCNVGAYSPEEYGGHYAWGETDEKEVYEWSTYIHCNGSKETCYDLSSDISGTEYDVAHVKWGGKWRMPTLDEVKELFEHCTNQYSTYKGVKGRKFISNINGNSIFLPAAGTRWGSGLYNAGNNGDYWSSSQDLSNMNYAYESFFIFNAAVWSPHDRYEGLSIRPVTK